MRPHLELLLAVVLCCGCRGEVAAPPWETRPDTTWVSARFEDYFDEVAIEDSATGQRGIFAAESGYRFSRKATLRFAYIALRPAALRIAVESRSGGESAGGWARTVEPGSGVLTLGTFTRDLYLLHAFVSGARVAVIPFASE